MVLPCAGIPIVSCTYHPEQFLSTLPSTWSQNLCQLYHLCPSQWKSTCSPWFHPDNTVHSHWKEAILGLSNNLQSPQNTYATWMQHTHTHTRTRVHPMSSITTPELLHTVHFVTHIHRTSWFLNAVCGLHLESLITLKHLLPVVKYYLCAWNLNVKWIVFICDKIIMSWTAGKVLLATTAAHIGISSCPGYPTSNPDPC